jgi:hypothetical protein
MNATVIINGNNVYGNINVIAGMSMSIREYFQIKFNYNVEFYRGVQTEQTPGELFARITKNVAFKKQKKTVYIFIEADKVKDYANFFEQEWENLLPLGFVRIALIPVDGEEHDYLENVKKLDGLMEELLGNESKEEMTFVAETDGTCHRRGLEH